MDQTKVMELFERAMALPPHQRDEFLAAACGGDDALRREVESLLAAQDEAGDFLGAITVDPAKTATAQPPASSVIGTRIGRYRLDSLLGEGGFGSVYRARQEEPVRRDVALKIIKPGMDSRQVIARFEAERQALATLDHSHIARVYDAGTTDNLRPYFVMEYVPGKPITQFCDDNKLSIKDRLLLFTQACEAIAHAHTKAIIHRDVKTSNVLAYMHDGKPTVKVIDFGIAKALRGDRLTDGSFNTEQGAVIGTYDSMSPEQADGSPDIDTRTDVYSLGVLLYELLTGAKPFDHKTLAKAADAEIRRIIREVEPPRPSTRLSRLGEVGTKVAQLRQSRQDSLAKQLRSELEWIPLKAMRKERSRRYDSPQQIAEDIHNYLAGKPLRAGPESRAYRAAKFLKRNKRGVAASAAMVLFALLGTVFYIHSMRTEHRKTLDALAQVTEERDNARATFEYVREIAVNLGMKYGDANEVESLLLVAIGGQRRVLGSEHPDTKFSVAQLADWLWSHGRSQDVEPILRELLEWRRQKLGENHPETVMALFALANTLARQHNTAEAELLYRREFEISKTITDNPGFAAGASSHYGVFLTQIGRYAEAEAPLLESLQRLEAAGRAKSDRAREVLQALVRVYTETERQNQAARFQSKLSAISPTTQR